MFCKYFCVLVIACGFLVMGFTPDRQAKEPKLWKCTENDAHQLFSLTDKGFMVLDGGPMVLRNQTLEEMPKFPFLNAPVLAEAGISVPPSSHVILAPPASMASQTFAKKQFSNGSVIYEVLEGAPGLCLAAQTEDLLSDVYVADGTVNSFEGAPGTRIALLSCDSGEALWREEEGRIKFVGGASQFWNETLCLDSGSFGSCEGEPFCNKSLPPMVRAKDLASRLSDLELSQMLGGGYVFAPKGIPRLGVPPLPILEGAHGVMAACGNPCQDTNAATGCPTVFPAVPNLGATFNRTLWSALASTIAIEARGLYNQIVPCGAGIICERPGPMGGLKLLAPNHNLARDPRWGRIQEVASEDVFVTAEFTKEYLNGLHVEKDGVFAAFGVSKHLLAYDFENDTTTTRFAVTVNLTREDIAAFYAPAFRAAVADAKARSIMCAYIAYRIDGGEGIPACANGDVIGEVRERYGLADGYVVSDDLAVYYEYAQHHFASSAEDAVVKSWEAGVELNLGFTYDFHLVDLLNKSVIPRKDMEEAVSRVAKVMAELGLLDQDEGPFDNLGPCDVGTLDATKLAKEAAEQSMVLLTNPSNLLPLSTTLHLAAIGPYANASLELLANYNGISTVIFDETPVMGLSRAFSSVSYAQGAAVDGNDQSMIPEAVEVAKKADAVILFLTPQHSGENVDRTRLGLNPGQEALAKAILSVSSKVVIVELGCSMLTLPSDLVSSNASILWAFCPGEKSGTAIARTIAGQSNPSGRLPISVYPETYLNRSPINMSLQDATYAWWTSQSTSHYGPLQFEFGHGGPGYANIQVESITPLPSIPVTDLCSAKNLYPTLSFQLRRQSTSSFPASTPFITLAETRFPKQAINPPGNALLLGFNTTMIPSSPGIYNSTLTLDLRYLIRPLSTNSSKANSSFLTDGVAVPGTYSLLVGGPEAWFQSNIVLSGTENCVVKVGQKPSPLIW